MRFVFLKIFLSEHDGSNTTIDVIRRESMRPDADEMMALRIILLIITFGSTLKDILEVRTLIFWRNLQHIVDQLLFINTLLAPSCPLGK